MTTGKYALITAALLAGVLTAAAWEVVLPTNPTTSETTAARELKDYAPARRRTRPDTQR